MLGFFLIHIFFYLSLYGAMYGYYLVDEYLNKVCLKKDYAKDENLGL